MTYDVLISSSYAGGVATGRAGDRGGPIIFSLCYMQGSPIAPLTCGTSRRPMSASSRASSACERMIARHPPGTKCAAGTRQHERRRPLSSTNSEVVRGGPMKAYRRTARVPLFRPSSRPRPAPAECPRRRAMFVNNVPPPREGKRVHVLLEPRCASAANAAPSWPGLGLPKRAGPRGSRARGPSVSFLGRRGGTRRSPTSSSGAKARACSFMPREEQEFGNRSRPSRRACRQDGMRAEEQGGTADDGVRTSGWEMPVRADSVLVRPPTPRGLSSSESAFSRTICAAFRPR